MKKIKQFANHAFVRPGDRTEVLSEQLLEAEKRIDQIKLTVESTARKVHACIHRKDKDKDNKDRDYADPFEKRIKKLPEILLGNSMIADSKQLGDDSVLGDVLGETGQIEIKLGQEAVKFEMKIENEVLKPLQKFMKMFSDINKLREKLTKYTSDMDSAKARLQQATRHSLSGGQGGKIDNFKEEWEEAQQKVEQYRDNLATEMYSVISKESEISRCIVNFLTYQKEYHHSVYSILKELIPNAESSIAKSIHKPVYGVKLDDHLNTTGRSIAYPIELCVCGLLETALEEEGLFRMAGSASKVKKLKSAFDAGLVDLTGLLGEFSDAHVIANALKSYLRELKEPLLTFDLYAEWMNAIRLTDNDEKLKAIWTVVQKLPKPNFENLQYLVKFLKELTNHQDINKMSTANIAIVIAPNLLWDNPEASGLCTGGADSTVGDSNQMGLNMTMTHHYSSVLDQLITYSDYFFPEEIDFFVTCEKPKEHEKAVLLTNGGLPSSVAEECSNSEVEGGSQMKRSYSNSSVDEHGNTGPLSPHGSPKPVIRRKNKPAPVPPTAPTVNKNPLAHFSATANSPSSPNSPSGFGDMVQRSSSGATSKHPVNPNKYVGAGAPIPFSPKSSFDMGLAIVGKKSNEKREAMWIPPSPRETVRKNVTTTENNSTSIMGPPPVKPPPPSIESLSKTGNVISGGEVQSQKPALPPASPLRHKSSFKSSNSVENNLSISSPGSTVLAIDQINKNNTTDNINPRGSVGGCQSPSTFSSLPRHFHTENSYKNAGGRPSRPPSMWGVPPPSVPPPAPPVTTSTSQQSSTQSPVSLPPVPGPVSTEGMTTKELEEQSPASLHLGFEGIEATVRKDSLPLSLNDVKTADSPVIETADRPIPAPRSSLLTHSQSSISNTVTGGVPVVRERPSLMAKPRDLSKRNLHGLQQQSTGSTSERPLTVPTGSSGNKGGKDVNNFRVSDYEKRHSRSSSGGGLSDVADSDSLQEFSKDNDNPGAVDEMSGESQSGRGKPPRPQPPAPPKVRVSQAESTDL